jgi:hypothetical protein
VHNHHRKVPSQDTDLEQEMAESTHFDNEKADEDLNEAMHSLLSYGQNIAQATKKKLAEARKILETHRLKFGETFQFRNWSSKVLARFRPPWNIYDTESEN